MLPSSDHPEFHPDKVQTLSALLSPTHSWGDKAVMVGFKDEKLYDQEVLDLPEDCTSNWLACVHPSTKVNFGELLNLPASKHLAPSTIHKTSLRRHLDPDARSSTAPLLGH